MVVVLGQLIGRSVFQLIVIVPEAVEGPSRDRQPFELALVVVSVPLTLPLVTVIAGLVPSGVAVQPLSVPLIVATSLGAPVPAKVSDGLNPSVAF